MPKVSHAVRWTCHHETTPQNGTTLKRIYDFGDFANSEVNAKDIRHGVFEKKNDTEMVMVKQDRREISSNSVNDNENSIEYSDKIEHNDILLNDNDETIRNYGYNNTISTNNKTPVKEDENVSKTKIRRFRNEEDNRTDSFRMRNKEELIKKPRWRLNSGMLVTLVILNVTGQGTAVEGSDIQQHTGVPPRLPQHLFPGGGGAPLHALPDVLAARRHPAARLRGLAHTLIRLEVQGVSAEAETGASEECDA
ncbi:Uncharacterized protein OBRU01_01529 [Operophtera brumata]|uniref:Uncharacterized protein n=1 Tax=Operophtera brumata TaxID=104452 RepID=A0A0L7LJH3_OPEBR|nr:Uncharacterized protein OBRU01_01529 [Operophtera brumata]